MLLNCADILLSGQEVSILTYLIPDDFCKILKVGHPVEVELQNRLVTGYVLNIYSRNEPFSFPLKPILSIQSQFTFFDNRTVKLLNWVSEYYLASPRKVLQSILPVGTRSNSKFKKFTTEAISKVLGEPNKKKDQENLELSNLQISVVADIFNSKSTYNVLYGVTGSGKTEVYIKLIHQHFKLGKSSIYLIPEVALATALHKRLKPYFNNKLFLVHSRMTPKQRREAWLNIYHGEQVVVLGTRSAVFAPVQNLGLIIIDEEHDNAFKQETSPRYSTRAVAYKRATLENAKLLCGSATPTINSYYQAEKTNCVHTLSERYYGTSLPEIEIINLKHQSNYPTKLLTTQLIREMQEIFKSEKGQVILYYNHRGLARSLRCNDCGEPLYCPRCSVTLTVHHKQEVLCHYCGWQQTTPEICPICNSYNLKSVGKGIQALENEVRKTFPAISFDRLDSDSIKESNKIDEILTRFSSGESRLLIGTQMISKGYDFPNVEFVGIIDIDSMLLMPDIYGHERAFQQIVQVAGRCGRAKKQGKVLMQTAFPNHPVIQFALKHDYLGFYKHEIQERKNQNKPPFRRFIRIIGENHEEEKVEKEIHEIFETFKSSFPQNILYEPSPALIEKIKMTYRWHFIIVTSNKANEEKTIKTFIGDQLSSSKIKSTFKVDVDPMNLIF